MKPIHIALLIMLCSAIACLALTPTPEAPSKNKTTLLRAQHIEQWREDIDFMRQQLEQRHIHLYHKITADFFSNELTRIKQQLPTLTETNLKIELMRLIKQVGDGHTQFAYWGSEHRQYPLELRMFGEELRLISIDQKYRHLLGATLIAIEDLPIEQILPLITPILQGVENIYSEKQRLCETIRVAEVLHGLKISKNLQQTSFTFKLANSEEHNIILNSLSMPQFQTYAMSSFKLPKPVNFSMHKISTEGIDLLLSNNGQIAYLDFHHYPTFSAMQDFAEDLIDLLREKKTSKVIIDLRNNGGGDFFVGLQLAWALIMVDSLDWREGMYVLIGRKTFSAAMSNAAQYRQLLNATLVGEPTGANPVGYQDAGTFSLPHSGWTVMYSKRRYRFQDSESAGVEPDVRIDLDWDSYQSGKDKLFDWILNNIQSHHHIISQPSYPAPNHLVRRAF